MPVSRKQFVKRLIGSGLMSRDEWSEYQSQISKRKQPKDADALEKRLVADGKLTRFQATAVRLGKTRNLVIGNYVVQDRIGGGGMGVVYRAHHRRMDRVVAIKILPPWLADQHQFIERFHRETRAAARLMHPNIVTAYDADQVGQMHFLVMEYVEGTDLSAVVKCHGPLSVSKAVEYVLQVATGLLHAHRQKIIHRDIKPHNLLLDREDTVKILDMGLAGLEGMRRDQPATGTADSELAEPEDSGITQAGQFLGTPDYISPEQARDAHSVDDRADIYSLGCVLYYLLTGSPPYKGASTADKVRAHRDQPIPSLCDSRPGVPPLLDAAFSKMVAKRMEDRFQSMSEVITAMQRCLTQLMPAAGKAADASAPPRTSQGPDGRETPRPPKPPSRRLQQAAIDSSTVATKPPPLPTRHGGATKASGSSDTQADLETIDGIDIHPDGSVTTFPVYLRRHFVSCHWPGFVGVMFGIITAIVLSWMKSDLGYRAMLGVSASWLAVSVLSMGVYLTQRAGAYWTLKETEVPRRALNGFAAVGHLGLLGFIPILMMLIAEYFGPNAGLLRTLIE